jgi:protein-S-isoprenylcysteine O-methyltransferase Ste14
LGGLVSPLFWWTHLALDGNYDGTIGLHDNQQLVIGGPHQFVRHPTCVA